MTTPLDDLNTTQNVATGSVVASAWFDKARDNIETLSRMPGCKVVRTAVQSVATGAVTPVAFSATDIRDTDSYHDIGTNNTRVTVPAGLGGWYDCKSTVEFAANAAGTRYVGFRVGGLTLYEGTWGPTAGAGVVTIAHYSEDIRLNAGEYLEVVAYQNSGAALDVTGFASMRLVALA